MENDKIDLIKQYLEHKHIQIYYNTITCQDELRRIPQSSISVVYTRALIASEIFEEISSAIYDILDS